ncbi:MAG: PfkB family carbohydrate kinase [Clostridia bacterium]|nr:PfkB family carbohydrate kinase [Clostridia bacterium]
MKKNVLLLGDLTGKSRVALRMLTSALEARGHEALVLPTALISNTLNLGRHAALDTTDYLLDALDVYEHLGIGYDVLYIGYITGLAQARALCAVADRARKAGVPVLLDPILGDGGKRYCSVTGEQEEGMRLMMRRATLITPNLTEAALLAGVPYEEARRGGDALARMAKALTADGCAAVVTSARTGDGGHAVLVCEPGREPLALPYNSLPGHHFGTGDLYCAELICALLAGRPLPEAARTAAERVALELKLGEEGILPRD